jgi:hypothetical protein
MLRRGELRDLLSGEAYGTRLVAVSCPGPAQGIVPQECAARLRDSLHAGIGSTSAVHILLARYGEGVVDDAVAWMGWHNLVVAPEDAPSPEPMPPPVIIDGQDDVGFVVHAAAALVAVGGLWAEMPVGPLDGEFEPSSAEIRVVRCFSRRLDVGRTGLALRVALTDRSSGQPWPRDELGRLQRVEDGRIASEQAQRAVWARHPELFDGPTVGDESAPDRMAPNRSPGHPVGLVRWWLAAATRRTGPWTRWTADQDGRPRTPRPAA